MSDNVVHFCKGVGWGFTSGASGVASVVSSVLMVVIPLLLAGGICYHIYMLANSPAALSLAWKVPLKILGWSAIALPLSYGLFLISKKSCSASLTAGGNAAEQLAQIRQH